MPCGSFNRSNDPKYPATTSSFRLDRYEVTVGRFRKFVEAGAGTKTNPPAVGLGAHEAHPTSTGWYSAWNTYLADDTAHLQTLLKCEPLATWTDTPGANENKPINCVSWYMAFAFCVWDGGRLPTETEWNYAAASGADQTLYATDTYPSSPISNTILCDLPETKAVGSKQYSYQGWWHWDLSGNVEEWTYDKFAPYVVPCENCLQLTNGTSPTQGRVKRGGNYFSCLGVTTTKRSSGLETIRWAEVGLRCAREY